MAFTATIGTFIDGDGEYKRNCIRKRFKTSTTYNITAVKTPPGATDLDLQLTINTDDDSIRDTNYCYIEHYGKYYFVTAHSNPYKGVHILNLHEDTLTTLAAGIKASKGSLLRSENKYNMYLVDGRLPRPKQAVYTTQKFPNTPFRGTMAGCGVIVGILGSANGH